jgi:hypothetical protein
MTLPAGPDLIARLEAPPAGLLGGWVLDSSYETTIISSSVSIGVGAGSQQSTGHGRSFSYGPPGPFVVAEAMQASTPFIYVHVVEGGFGALQSGAPAGFHVQVVENGAEDVVFAAPTTVTEAELDAFVASVRE